MTQQTSNLSGLVVMVHMWSLYKWFITNSTIIILFLKQNRNNRLMPFAYIPISCLFRSLTTSLIFGAVFFDLI